jgi:hypothetical protein
MSYAEIGRTMGYHRDPARPICGTAAKILVLKRERYLRLTAHEFGPLRVAVRNALAKSGILTVSDLCCRTAQELLEIKNFGEGSLYEVERFLADLGYGLATTRTGDDAWAPVSDRLPGDGKRVLVFSPLYTYELGEWAGTEAGWRDRYGHPLDGVTHWRSLPEAPNV